MMQNNDRTLWLPATVVRAADHGSYIVKVIGGAEYRRARDHIREHLGLLGRDCRVTLDQRRHPTTATM